MPATAVGQAPAASATVPRVICAGRTGVSDIERRRDGGYRVEGPTHTIVYWGDDAARYLDGRKVFAMDTEVVVPRDTTVTVDVDGERFTMSEPGAFLIGGGAEAEVHVEHGAPMVIRSSNAPMWYGRLSPGGEHRSMYDEIAHINQKLYNWRTCAGRFEKGDLERLKAAGVVREDSQDGRYVEWQVFPSHGAIRRHLESLGLPAETIERTMPIWSKARQRRLYGPLSGRLGPDLLPPPLMARLEAAHTLVTRAHDPEEPYWSEGIATEDDLRARLPLTDYAPQEVGQVVDAWRRTTRSGFDNTGLAFEKGKVVGYVLGDKINMWSEQDTEWMVNSTAYAGQNEPFHVGVSYVRARDPVPEPVDFKQIRPLETLHRHPRMEAREQTEAYLVRSGRAALLTITDRGPVVHLMEAGDMAVVEPDVIHCVLAVQGPYEHVVAQVPSAFQYGFMFKHNEEYETYGLREDVVRELGKAALATGARGSVLLRVAPPDSRASRLGAEHQSPPVEVPPACDDLGFSEQWLQHDA